MIRVRFHLAPGEHHRMWQISAKGGDTRYVCPSDNQLVMRGCRLRNRRRAAEEILRGAHKMVCAWVECEEVEIAPTSAVGISSPVLYNPRIAPHWVDDNQDADGRSYPLLFTSGRGIFRPAA